MTAACFLMRASQRTFKILLLLALFSIVMNYKAVSVLAGDSNDTLVTESCACPLDAMSGDYYIHDCDSSESCFRCLNSRVVIPREAVCNYVMDCPDLSDELLCSSHDYQNKFVKDESHRNKLLNASESVGPCWNFYSSKNVSTACGNNIAQGCNIRTEIGRTSWQICNCSFEFCPYKDSCASDCNSEGSCQDVEERSQVFEIFSIPLTVTGYFIGISAILGNTAVLLVTARCLYRERAVLTVEQRLTKYFFFSLSLSDLMIGIYTVAICVILQDLRHSEIDDLQFNHLVVPCDTLGALALIGSEQSVFTMLLITSARVYGIVRPFSRIRLRVFMISLSICWIISILIATLPLFNIVEDIFVQVVRQNEVPVLTTITQESVDDLNSILQAYSKSIESSRPSGSWAKLLYFMNELFHVKTTYRFGYYHGLGLCLPNYFPMATSYAMWYSLILFTLNVFCFVLMVTGYIVIYYYRRQPRKDKCTTCAEAVEESKMLKRKISLILATDFMCWIPVCALGFANIQQQGLADRDCNQSDIREELTASLFSILLVLPINSAVNPFLYSAAPEYLHKRIAAFSVLVKEKLILSAAARRHDGFDSCNSIVQTSTIVETLSECPELRGTETETTKSETIQECHL